MRQKSVHQGQKSVRLGLRLNTNSNVLKKNSTVLKKGIFKPKSASNGKTVQTGLTVFWRVLQRITAS